MKTQEERVFIGKYETTFIFKVEGRLTQKSLWNANTAVQKCLEDHTISDVLIDITLCTYMDSTILGILARWAITFAKTHHGVHPFLIGLEGTPLESIFRRMNLTTLFQIAEQVPGIKKNMLSPVVFSEQYGPQEYAAHLLSAHETLAELSPENAREFAAVIQYLKSDMNAQA